MKMRFDYLQDAGDLIDSAVKKLMLADEKELAGEACALLDKLYNLQDQAWSPAYAEPELENA